MIVTVNGHDLHLKLADCIAPACPEAPNLGNWVKCHFSSDLSNEERASAIWRSRWALLC